MTCLSPEGLCTQPSRSLTAAIVYIQSLAIYSHALTKTIENAAILIGLN